MTESKDERFPWGAVPRPIEGSTSPSSSAVVPTVLAIALVLLTVNLLASWRVAVVVLVVIVSSLTMTHVGPEWARRFGRRVQDIQHRVGDRVRRGLLTIAWVLCVLPLSLFIGSSERLERQGWVTHSGHTVDARRQFTKEPSVAARRRSKFSRLIFLCGAVVALIAADLAAGSLANSLSSGGDSRADLAAYEASEWAADYWSEFSEVSDFRYEAFSGWRRADYAGRYINVENGIRSTWRSSDANPDAIDIWVFGGSTTWGSGQRDDFTIPSQIAKLAHDSGIQVRVTNYGESGYLLWQEVQRLEAILLGGGEPDLVLFYDGVNEPVPHGRSPSRAPRHARDSIFAQRLEAPLSETLEVEYKKRSLIVRMLRTGRGFLRSPSDGGRQRPIAHSPSEAVGNMMAIYSHGVSHASELAVRHEFEVRFFWQPNIYTKQVDESDSDAWDVVGYATWDRDWFRHVYREARKQLPASVIDVADALDSAPGPVMIDHSHTNELGAELVAQRIFAEITPLLLQLSDGDAQ